MARQRKRKQAIPEPAEMRIPDRKYQPSRSELREEMDMPELSVKEAREAFMRPFRVVTDDPD